MKRIFVALFALFAASAAHAQISYPSVLPNMAAYALVVSIPTPAVDLPPCVADAGSIGTGSTVYALANHTHCSKVRKGIDTTATNGVKTVTYTTAFSTGIVPICNAIAAPTAGTTDIYNMQLDGDPNNTTATFRLTRSVPTLNGLLSLVIPIVAATPGATKFQYECFEP